MADTFRWYADFSTTQFYDLSNHVEAKANAIAIHYGCALKFSEASEKLRKIFFSYSSSSVDYMYY